MRETSAAKLSIDAALLPAARGAWTLDVGCGDGRHLRAAAARGSRAIGIDYDAAEVRHARARLGPAAYFVVADAAHLPFREGALDAVICTETLEHLPDDSAALAEIARVLRQEAPLLAAVPSHFTEMVYWRLSRGYWDTPGGHVRVYSPRALATTLAGAGLAMESMRYLHFFDSIVWLRFCFADFL
jgi:ubiquinone/menaquinone biosynthesis C-methylase UbiE